MREGYLFKKRGFSGFMIFNKIRKIIFGVVAAIIFLAVFIGYYTHTTLPADIEGESYDLIIITGEGTSNKTLLGNVPERLDYAVKLFEGQQYKPRIILSGYGGGYVVRGEGEAEADLMYQRLVPEMERLGFNSEEFLLRENKSHHTLENAVFSKRLFKEDETNILVLVTPKAYYRVKLIFNSVFEQEVKVVSLREQSRREKLNEVLRTIGILPVLIIPNDDTKLDVYEKLYLFFIGESCMKDGLINTILCVGT